ncbi:ankyrin repeat domain-containing protein [Streptomyces murinus]|uniref:ankyrin repeat domain-containing protein n=1 Tax=Streptomyces murinus TaxID=33900 RepID=UPI0037FFCD3D
MWAKAPSLHAAGPLSCAFIAGSALAPAPLYRRHRPATASVNGEAQIALLLLTAGARPDTESAGPGAEGTPLCAAACWGHTETVRALLAHGADPNLREDHGTGRTPLEWALLGPYPETADRLTAAGAAAG